MKNEGAQKIVFDKIKNKLLSSALEISKPIYNNFNMCLSRNISIYNSIQIEDYNNLEMGLGLKALEKINKNQEIMTIPIISGLNGLEMLDIKSDENLKILKRLIHNIANSYAQIPYLEEENNNNKNFIKPKNKIDEFKYEKMLQTQSLIWQLIVGSINKDSYNYDLINSFPKEELTQLAYFDRNIIEKMTSISLKFFYNETISAFKYIYDQIVQEGIFELSQETFLWAYCNALSRKISIIDYYNTKNLNDSNASDKGSPIELIAPLVEYINHSSKDANVILEPDYDYELKQSIIRVYACNDIEQGQQLLLDYTETEKFNNRQLINRYGFFDKENPNKNIEIPFLLADVFNLFELNKEEVFDKFTKLLENDNLKSFKNELLKKAKLLDFENKFFKLVLHDNKFDIELLKFLRIVFLMEEDLNDPSKKANLLNFDFSKKFSDSNERLVLSFCIGIIDKYYEVLKGNDYDKIIEGDLGKVESKDEFILKNMYLLENEEKNLLEKNLNFLKKKLNTLI